LKELQEDLARMGCGGLLDIPWNFRDKAMVREVLEGALNQFKQTLRCDPSRWTEEQWQMVYGSGKEAKGMHHRRTTSCEVNSNTM
jgi:hypothetical protein